MANQTHSTITDPEIHETKGYKDAAAGTVKMATGSGASTFNRPLELISSFDESDSSQVTIDFTGLEDYRTLIIVIEQYGGTTNNSVITQFSTNNGSSFRNSGYKTGWIDTDSDQLNPQTSGCFLFATSSASPRGHCIATISNFNDSGNYTSQVAKWAQTTALQTGTASISSNREPGSGYGYYPTNEAHNALRITGLVSQSNPTLLGTLWGIRG